MEKLMLVNRVTFGSDRNILKPLFIRTQQCIFIRFHYNIILTMCNKYAETELLDVAVPEMTEQLVKDKPGRADKMFYYPDKRCIRQI